MSDNPFAEPGDSDKTLVRGPGGAPAPARPTPMPGPAPGSTPMNIAPVSGPMDFAPRGQTAPPPVTSPAGSGEAAPRLAGEAEEIPRVGVSPLAAAAAPILDLIGRLAYGGAVRVPDASELRERAIRALRQFEVDARNAEVPPEQMRAAHYALCSGLDDVALATPWGSQSVWATRTLCATFHQEVVGG
ncbi:MAG TPA: DotU family type IV/VI secretion system protein, partial [Acetobacteraceae bacterium]|nr:DotU family type IV/VI secretion system protein [Acetobacteraceae bacterium]